MKEQPASPSPKRRVPDTYQEAVAALAVAERSGEYWYRELLRAQSDLLSAEIKFGKIVNLARSGESRTGESRIRGVAFAPPPGGSAPSPEEKETKATLLRLKKENAELREKYEDADRTLAVREGTLLRLELERDKAVTEAERLRTGAPEGGGASPEERTTAEGGESSPDESPSGAEASPDRHRRAANIWRESYLEQRELNRSLINTLTNRDATIAALRAGRTEEDAAGATDEG